MTDTGDPDFSKDYSCLSFKREKIGGHSPTFSGIAHYLRCVKPSQNSVLLQRFEFQSIYGLIISVSFQNYLTFKEYIITFHIQPQIISFHFNYVQ